MPTVNSNIAAKYALNNLNKTDRDLTTAMERLSSGKESIMLETMPQVPLYLTE